MSWCGTVIVCVCVAVLGGAGQVEADSGSTVEFRWTFRRRVVEYDVRVWFVSSKNARLLMRRDRAPGGHVIAVDDLRRRASLHVVDDAVVFSIDVNVLRLLRFSATCYEHDVRLSVCNVGRLRSLYDRSVSWLPACRPGLHPVVRGMEKCGVFCTSAASSGSHVALSRHLPSFFFVLVTFLTFFKLDVYYKNVSINVTEKNLKVVF